MVKQVIHATREKIVPPQRQCGICDSRTFYVYGHNGERPVFRCASCQEA